MNSKNNGVFVITPSSSGHKNQKLSDEHDNNNKISTTGLKIPSCPLSGSYYTTAMKENH